MENRDAIDLDLKRYLLGWKRHWISGTSIFLLTLALAGVSSLFLKRTYEAQGQLRFQKVDRTSTLTGLGEESGQLNPLLADQTPLSTEVEEIYSFGLLDETIEKLDLQDSENKRLKPEDFKKKLDVEIVGATDVIEVSYKSENPKESADVVNTLMQAYIDNNIRRNRTEASAAREFIAKEMPQVEQKVLTAESQLREFKEQNGILNISREEESAVSESANLKREITRVEAELKGTSAKVNALKKQLGLNLQEAMAANVLSQSPAIQSTIEELKSVEGQLANERQRFLDTHPTIVQLQDKKAALQKNLKQESERLLGKNTKIPEGLLQISEVKQTLLEEYINAEVQRRDLVEQLDFLKQSQNNYRTRNELLPKLDERLKQLERQVNAARTAYEGMLSRQIEVQMATNINTANARIINPAVVPDRGSSGRMMVLALGGLLGLLFSTTYVLWREMTDKSLKTLKEVKDSFGYPLLGTLPQISNKALVRYGSNDLSISEMPIRDAADSYASEIYRTIQANLKFLSFNKHLKVIVVTSAVPKEGKSTVSANLAGAIAQMGSRVLLIDADLRRPCQHHLWRLDNTAGLSNALIGQTNVEPIPCREVKGLDILPAGVIPPNPLALLESGQMSAFITSIAQQYDYVILDAPPLLLTADALTLARMADGILLVARPKIVDRESAANVKETLERANQTILGMVVNGANDDEMNSSLNHARPYFLNADLNSPPQPRSLAKKFKLTRQN
jgi:polysaccharide biosynthesis transport protein